MRNKTPEYTIAVIEDDVLFAETVKDFLNKKGFTTKCFPNAQEGKENLLHEYYDVALIDQNLPDSSGEELAQWIYENSPGTKVIIMTAYPDIKKAIKAIKAGAFDYLIKPINPEELLILVNRALEFQKIEDYGEYSWRAYGKLNALKGKSEALRRMLEFIELSSSFPRTPILISGETGTGKTLLARLIHYHSSKGKPFLSINCAAIPDELIESELFGFEKGAFTGASRTKKGLFEIARDGSIFLDEIGDMSFKMQAKLLHVLDSGIFRRVGGEKKMHLRARIITATNKNIEELISKGKFRKDLYYRIAVLKFHIPPLRHRKEDIIPIAEFFLKRMGANPEELLDREVRKILLSYDYPGNIRELRNIIERAYVLGRGKKLVLTEILSSPTTALIAENGNHKEEEFLPLKEMEKRYVITVLNAQKWNKSRTANILGISLSTLKRKLKQWGYSNWPIFPKMNG